MSGGIGSCGTDSGYTGATRGSDSPCDVCGVVGVVEGVGACAVKWTDTTTTAVDAAWDAHKIEWVADNIAPEATTLAELAKTECIRTYVEMGVQGMVQGLSAQTVIRSIAIAAMRVGWWVRDAAPSGEALAGLLSDAEMEQLRKEIRGE